LHGSDGDFSCELFDSVIFISSGELC